MDGVEQRHRFLGLVGLQRADQVQRQAVVLGQKRRPFGLRLLHAVFAEHALAGGDRRLDRLGRKRLRHRDQRHLRRVAPGILAGARDLGADGGEACDGGGIGRNLGHASNASEQGLPVKPPVDRQSPFVFRPRTLKDPQMPPNSSKNERYNAGAAEARWQKTWDERGIFATQNDDPRPKYYVLEMFPYPSGRIHMGHVRNYTMGDVVARFKRAMGNAVLHPMGWDAFGMPAENAAIDRKVHPKAWTYDNIAAMKTQLKSMGLSLDWARELATCDPAYYKHQQKMFLDFLKAGLVAREYRKVNWDPVDQTVLANEQVIDGRGWRSGAEVEQRDLYQWVFKISDYSQELLEALDTLDRWPDKVKLMQKNWIGRSEGLLLRFMLDPATHAQ